MVADVMASGYRHSTVLTREENEQIMRLLGNRCESLATSVVQLFSTEPPDHGSWVKKDAGVLCLVKDHLKRSYFLRIYCPTRKSLVWEHEVYNGMEYNQPRAFLHTFEGQEGIIAFNFASEDDARVMHNVLLQKLDRKQRRMERKSRSSYATSRHSSSPPSNFTAGNVPNPNPTLNGNQRPPAYQQQPRTMPSQLPPPALPGKGGKNKGSAKAKLTKADIGLPSGFRHVSHVGWDPNKGFDVDVEDPQLKHFFVKAGVSDTQLQDRETRQFIYDFINQHGGLEAVKEDESFAPPPVPARGPGGGPPPPPGARHAPPPPPPPNRTPAPPPPPARTLPQRQPEQQHQQQHQHQQPARPNNNNAAAPPPPPPPPPPPSAPALDMPPPVRSGAEPDAHSALMDAIKGGKSLKPAAESEPRPSSGGDSRDELLDQIRCGKQLKPVQHVERPPPLVGTADVLANALSRALAERKRANQSDSDSDSDNSDSDNDWSDN